MAEILKRKTEHIDLVLQQRLETESTACESMGRGATDSQRFAGGIDIQRF